MAEMNSIVIKANDNLRGFVTLKIQTNPPPTNTEEEEEEEEEEETRNPKPETRNPTGKPEPAASTRLLLTKHLKFRQFNQKKK